MANVYAIKTGNWSDITVWNTGALPTSADDVYSNTFTVTIDTSPTVRSVQNGSNIGITTGGKFIPSNGITLTCTASTGVLAIANTPCIDSALTTGQSATVIANLLGGDTSSAIGINHTGTGTINIVGNCTGGSGGGGPSYGARNNGGGTMNITGNCYGSGNGNHGAVNNSTGVMNITGICQGIATNNNGGSGAYNASSGVINITGLCIAGAYANGNVFGLTVASGTANVVGTIQSNGVCSGVTGNGKLIATGPFITNGLGINPVAMANLFWSNSGLAPTYYELRKADLSLVRSLYTADYVGGNPAVANVRAGTTYGPAGELTGTCAVPNANSVAYGVPVDNTTGTAVLTTTAVKDACSKAVVPALLALG